MGRIFTSTVREAQRTPAPAIAGIRGPGMRIRVNMGSGQ